MQVLKRIGARLAKLGYLVRATCWAAVLGVIELVQHERGRRILAVLSLGALGGGFIYMKPIRTINPGEVGVRVNRVTGHVGQLHEGWAIVRAGRARAAALSAARSDLPSGALAARRRRRAVPDGRGPVASASTWRCATRSIRRASPPSPRSCPPTSGASWSSRWSTASSIAPSPSTRCARSSRPSAPRSRRRSRTELKPDSSARRHRRAQRVHRQRRPAARTIAKGLESLLAEELSAEKMRYTLELKDKQVKEAELVADAEKVKREKAAEAAGQEEIIAAKVARGGDEARAAVQGEGDRAAPARGRGGAR